MKKNVIIIILSILLISTSGYIVYERVTKETTIVNTNQNESYKDSSNYKPSDNGLLNNQTDISDDTKDDISDIKKDEESNDNESSNSNKTNIIPLKTYESIITNDLSKLLSRNSLSELTNQDKLSMLFEMYKKEYGFREFFSKEDLNNIHKNSVLSNLEVKHEKINDYSIVNDYSASTLFDYDNETYRYANTGHSYENLKIINKELVEKSEKGDEITLSYKFIFLTQTSNKPVELKLYTSIDDIKNNKVFEKFSYYDINDEASYYMTIDKSKMHVKLNYDSIKDNLKIYTYTFKIEDNNITLANFYTK